MFKPINDTLGHKAGDTVLAEVAARFRANIEADDVAARLGGDEFILLLHLKDDRIRYYAESTVVNIMAALEAPIPYQEHDCCVGASIGISAYPFDGEDADTLVRKADAAMYTAKERGRGFYCFYSSVESEQES
jgi:diguanylate cyclase (GGDEF)-like protein